MRALVKSNGLHFIYSVCDFSSHKNVPHVKGTVQVRLFVQFPSLRLFKQYFV